MKSILSATSLLSPQPRSISWNMTASMDKLLLLWKMSTEIWTIFWVQKRLQLYGWETKVFKKDDNKDFGRAQNLTTWESYFNQFLRWRNQPVISAKNFGGEQHLSPMQIPTLSKDMDEQLKLAHRVIDFVDVPIRNIRDYTFPCSSPLPW